MSSPKASLRLSPLAAVSLLAALAAGYGLALLPRGPAAPTAAEPTAAVGGAASVEAEETPEPPASAPTDPTPVLIPRPKKVTFPAEAYGVGRDSQIVLSPKASAGARRGADILRAEFKNRFGLLLPIVEDGKTTAGMTPNTLLLVKRGAPAGPKPSAAPKKPEGYSVRVAQERVVICGNDAAGALWGAQTVAQLIDRGGDGVYVRGAEVEDWPSLKIRAVHLFHGKDALPFHKKLIDRVYSRYKMNAMFLQAEQVRWDSAPEVAPSWAGTPQQVREEVAYAREKGITVYPLIQSYGHMDKVLTTPATAKFAEDPQDPYALNYSDPRAVRFLEGIVTEADRTFQAPGFHFGLDEVTLKGRFPHQTKGKEFPEMYVSAAKRWNDWSKKRGKQMFMWADMAIHPVEVKPDFGTAPSPMDAAKVRAGLPKDVVMITWQYQDRKQFPSLKKLRQAGFSKVMAATWFRPGNIQNFSKAAVEAGAIGAVQTTWAGYESNETILSRKEREQFESMVLAAEYFWNGGEGPAPAKLPYKASEVFARQWEGAKDDVSSVAQR